MGRFSVVLITFFGGDDSGAFFDHFGIILGVFLRVFAVGVIVDYYRTFNANLSKIMRMYANISIFLLKIHKVLDRFALGFWWHSGHWRLFERVFLISF